MIVVIVIGVIVGLSVLATVLVFASVMLSSRISRTEEMPNARSAHANRPEPEPVRDLKREPIQNPN